jgi:CheY-like chemotaxis protein
MATDTRWMNAVVRFSKLLEPALSDDADDAKVALHAARILENGNLPDIEVVALSPQAELTESTVFGILSGKTDWHAIRLLVDQGKLPQDPGIDVRIQLSDDQWRQAGGKALAAQVGHGAARLPLVARTVLVVDDDADMLAYTTTVLEEAGYRVLAADGGGAALRVIERHADIDLVVTDIVMPKIDGLMLADMIKPQRPDLRILYTTGYADIEAMRSGTRLSDVIWKPYRSSELVATVKRALDAAAPSAA